MSLNLKATSHSNDNIIFRTQFLPGGTGYETREDLIRAYSSLLTSDHFRYEYGR